MEDSTGKDPDALREKAERCFRLAYAMTDNLVRDALVNYGRELQARADQMEANSR
jgi:hypothetical protein